jgi:hypothetical protein
MNHQEAEVHHEGVKSESSGTKWERRERKGLNEYDHCMKAVGHDSVQGFGILQGSVDDETHVEHFVSKPFDDWEQERDCFLGECRRLGEPDLEIWKNGAD